MPKVRKQPTELSNAVAPNEKHSAPLRSCSARRPRRRYGGGLVALLPRWCPASLSHQRRALPRHAPYPRSQWDCHSRCSLTCMKSDLGFHGAECKTDGVLFNRRSFRFPEISSLSEMQMQSVFCIAIKKINKKLTFRKKYRQKLFIQ